MAAIAGSLRPVRKPGIRLLGGVSGAFTGPQSLQFTAAGLHVGDVMLLTLDMVGTGAGLSLLGSGAQGDVFVAQSYDSGAASAHAVWYVVTQADADADAIPFQISGAGANSAVGTIWRNVDPVTPLDTNPSVGTGTDATSGGAMTAPGITTVTDGCLLMYGLLTHASGAPIFGTPAAFVGLIQEATTAPYQMTARATQMTAGAIPAVTGSVQLSPDGPVGWLATLIALRPLSPDITLAQELGTLKVGVAFAGSVTARRVGGARGDVILTATNLPIGLALGAMVDNGDESFTWPVTGTPSASGTFSASFSATNGIHNASSNWSGSVATNPLTLTGTLPDAIIGQNYHGELTLGGYYQTPVTIDASAGTIPTWMTVTQSGATINFDATAVQVPSSAETDTFTVRATDATTPNAQIATSAQTVVVSASAGPYAPVQVVAANFGQVASGTFTFATPAAGHLLILAVQSLSKKINTPSGWTLLTNPGNNAVGMSVYTRVADGTEGTLNWTTDVATRRVSMGLIETTGTIVGSTSDGLNSSDLSYGPSTSAPSTTAIPVFVNGCGSTSATSFTLDAPWSGLLNSTNTVDAYPVLMCWRDAPGTGTVTATGTRAGGGWNRWIGLWIEP